MVIPFLLLVDHFIISLLLRVMLVVKSISMQLRSMRDMAGPVLPKDLGMMVG
jgi:hypothetical protein